MKHEKDGYNTTTTTRSSKVSTTTNLSAEHSFLKVVCGTFNLALDPASTGAAADAEDVG